MSDAVAEAARAELYRRLALEADLYEQPFENVAHGWGLTTRQIEILQREQGHQVVEPTPEHLELKKRVAEGLWIEDKGAPRADPRERVFRRRCPKCGQWAKMETSGHEPIIAACNTFECQLDTWMTD